MGNFNRGDRSGGGRRFDNNRGSRRDGRSERPTMHHAVCSECGRDCEVPFRPSGDKPVFCSECFGNKENSNSGRSERRFSDRSNFGEKKMFKAVCDKCHKDCEVPFKPTGDKPVFCSDCFGKGEKSERREGLASSGKNEKQFETLNAKLDSILKILSPKTAVKKEIEKKNDDKKIETKKTVTPKKTVEKKTSPKKVEKKKEVSKKIVKKPVVKKVSVKKAVVKKKK